MQQGIAIAGTHGKTTTTSLIATILAQAKLDPTFVIGGKVTGFGTNAQIGQGDYFVAEADESDASFLHLSPMITVITNIDRDHLGTYNDDFEQLKKTFLEFIYRLPFYGLAVLCIDDPELKSLMPDIARPFITYGFSEEADVRAINWVQTEQQSTFQVKLPGREELLSISSKIPGKHNVLNTLAAITVALETGVGDRAICQALAQFQGIGRRFQVLGDYEIDGKKVLMVDDYGHHPREVKAVIDSIRAGWPTKRIVMVYQPHRYSRTKALFEDFVNVLSEVDTLVLLEVYSAGEKVINGADTRALCGSIRKRGKVEPIFIEDQDKLISTLDDLLKGGDILLTQGAGNISKIAIEIAKHFTMEQSTELLES